MSDTLDDLRRYQQAELNADAPKTREEAEQRWGRVWDTQQLGEDFEVHGFFAPYVVVALKKDSELGKVGQMGSLMFWHAPRFYFSWEPSNG